MTRAIQRYALVGVRPDVEDMIVKLRGVEEDFPRLTTARTAVAAVAAMLDEIRELADGDEAGEHRRRRRSAPRIVGPGTPSPTPPLRRRVRRVRRLRDPTTNRRKLAGAALSGAQRAWKVGRDTLTVLSMAPPQGLTIEDAADQLSTRGEAVSEAAARWRLNALVLRKQAALLQEKPPLYRITKLGAQCLEEDRDIREDDE